MCTQRAASNSCPSRRSPATPERQLLHGRWLKPPLHAFLMRPLTFSTIGTTAQHGIDTTQCCCARARAASTKRWAHVNETIINVWWTAGKCTSKNCFSHSADWCVKDAVKVSCACAVCTLAACVCVCVCTVHVCRRRVGLLALQDMLYWLVLFDYCPSI